MVEANNISSLGSNLFGFYKDFISTLPPIAGNFFNFLVVVLFIVLYSIFVWKFYRFISKKNILELDLNQYNQSSDPFLLKLFAGFFYFIEYIIVLPFLILFWFTIFSVFLIFLTEQL